MEPNNRLPPPLDCSNLAKDWPSWKRSFVLYMIANNKLDGDEREKLATFLWLAGKQATEIYNAIFPSDGSPDALLGTIKKLQTSECKQRTLDEVIKAFDDYCAPQRNAAMEAFKFRQIHQKERQPFVEFETELRTQSQHCSYKCKWGLSYENRLIQDQVIVGIGNKNLQFKLLEKEETLKDVVLKCKAYKSAVENKSLLKEESINSVAMEEDQSVVNAVRRSCFSCGHPFSSGHYRVCKARGIVCRSCGREGHFQKFCKTHQRVGEGHKEGAAKEKKTDRVRSIDWTNLGNYNIDKNSNKNNNNNNYFNYRINSTGRSNDRWIKCYKIKTELINFKIDSGSDINCINFGLIKKLGEKFNFNCNNYNVSD